MPSFFEGLRRITQGQPVFDPNEGQANGVDITQNQPAPQPVSTEPWMQTPGQPALAVSTNQPAPAPVPAQPQSPINKADNRTFPMVYIKHTRSQVSGNTMQVYCRISNASPMDIDVHVIKLLGIETSLRFPLHPGAEKEFLVYNGPRMQSTQYHDARLHYKTRDGDYFEAYHDIRFMLNSFDKTYVIDEINLHPPIRDIFE
jgi:hypothetical protein